MGSKDNEREIFVKLGKRIKRLRTERGLRQEDMEKIQSLGKKASESALPVLRNLFALPIVNVNKIKEWSGFSRPGAQKVIDRLIELEILEQQDKHSKYSRSYIYRRYVDIFSEKMES